MIYLFVLDQIFVVPLSSCLLYLLFALRLQWCIGVWDDPTMTAIVLTWFLLLLVVVLWISWTLFIDNVSVIDLHGSLVILISVTGYHFILHHVRSIDSYGMGSLTRTYVGRSTSKHNLSRSIAWGLQSVQYVSCMQSSPAPTARIPCCGGPAITQSLWSRLSTDAWTTY